MRRELFFHAPALMADVCDAAGLPDETERHLRYILDLTAGAGAGPGTSPATFWQYLPFRKSIPETIQEMLKALSDPGTDPKMLALKATTTTQILAWEKDPFNPYLIGRMRLGHVVFVAPPDRVVGRVVLRREEPCRFRNGQTASLQRITD